MVIQYLIRPKFKQQKAGLIVNVTSSKEQCLSTTRVSDHFLFFLEFFLSNHLKVLFGSVLYCSSKCVYVYNFVCVLSFS